MINEATKQNLRRKSVYVDDVQMAGDIPLFSWIDVNLTELCNRKCIFCPRVDPNEYPNQDLNMSLPLMRRMADELIALEYRGVVVFCGFGEPLLYPHLAEAISFFGPDIRTEVVTNGDRLTVSYIDALIKAGMDYMVISMYDGPHQIEQFKRLFEEAGYDESHYLLRDRWHTEEDNFGLKLTNRAGTVSIGKQDPVDVTHPCHYPAYSMTVDWNGDVLLCVQDWNKKVKMGNVYAQSLLEIWRSNLIQKYRYQLANGKRKLTPCNNCNTDGTLHGYNHVEKWRKAWGRSD